MSPRLNLRSVSSKRGEFAKCLLMPATRQPALYRSVLSQRSCTSGLPVSIAAACATPDAETAARHAADRPATADIRRLKLEFPDFILARSLLPIWIMDSVSGAWLAFRMALCRQALLMGMPHALYY